MTKNKIFWIVFLLIALFGCMVLLFNGGNEQFKWEKTYQDGLKEPYDFGLFKKLLQSDSAVHWVEVEHGLKKELEKTKTNEKAVYVFIGAYCFLSNSELQSLLQFAEKGNDVLFIAEGVPDTLLRVLNRESRPLIIDRMDEAEVLIESENVNSSLDNYIFKYRSYGQMYNIPVAWYYLKEDKSPLFYFGTTSQSHLVLNKISGHINFVKFKNGLGSIYIHTSPILFSNYALKEQQGFAYLDEVWSGINKDKIIYHTGAREFQFDSERIGRKSDSPLSYILKQRALKWAWYLFLLSVFLFFVFRAKRRQRIIHVQEPKKNTSIQFIDTLGGLYYKDGNHKHMAVAKMQMFTFFIRRKFNIPTHEINSGILNILAQKSKVPLQEIEKIFDYYNQVVDNGRDTLDAENLMELHHRISRFYTLYTEQNSQ